MIIFFPVASEKLPWLFRDTDCGDNTPIIYVCWQQFVSAVSISKKPRQLSDATGKKYDHGYPVEKDQRLYVLRKLGDLNIRTHNYTSRSISGVA